VIYDTYGEEGLKATWEVGPKFKTPEEVSIDTVNDGLTLSLIDQLLFTLSSSSKPNMKSKLD
jgi:hypothetical protein